MVERRITRDCFDAADARSNTALTRNLEEAEITSTLDVGAAAKFHREIADAKHAHISFVLLTKQRHCARGHRVLVVHELSLCSSVVANFRFDQPFVLEQL